MAQKVVVQVLDDITGEEGASTVRFGLDGVQYEIDLVSDEALRTALEPFIKHARRTGGAPARPRTPGAARPAGRPDPKAVRAWAKDQGMDINERGRVSKEIFDAYVKEHPNAA